MAYAIILLAREHEPLNKRLQYVNHHSLALGSFDAVAVNEIDTSVHAHVYVATLPSKQKPKISAEIAEMRWLPLHEPFFITVALLLKNHIIPALRVL